MKAIRRCAVGFTLCPFVAAALFTVSFAAADQFEPDDSPATAQRVFIGVASDLHTFDTPTDEDWAVFYVVPGNLEVLALSPSATCDVALTLFASDGVTPIEPPGEVDSGGPGVMEVLYVPEIDSAGFLYARFRNADPTQFGTGVTYRMGVNQGFSPGLPIETVDERTIGIRSAGQGQGNRRAVPAVLIPGVAGYYTRHRVEFPGYEETAPGTAIDVTIRRSTSELDRYDFPGQAFPWSSNALFIIETVQWTGGVSAPIAFTDPVNITVEFVPDPEYFSGDVVTLQTESSTGNQMRVVRDMIDGPGVDFRLIAGEQFPDAAQRIVTVRDYRGLTGASGQATWGAAARMAVTRARHWGLYR